MTDEIKKYKRGFSSTKEGGYATQKKYKASHPEKVREWSRNKRQRDKGKYYEPKIRIRVDYIPALQKLKEESGLSISQLFIISIKDKYGIALDSSVEDIND